MTNEEADFIGSMNMCDEISNKAYKKIMCNCEVEESQPCEDCISRAEALRHSHIEYDDDGERHRVVYVEDIEELPSVTPKQTRWIPIKTRPMTEEEKEEIGHEYAYMYDCPLPDDGQDVLITDCYGNVEVDTFYRDPEDFYFETNCDDDEVIAWMPLPEPYKGRRKE